MTHHHLPTRSLMVFLASAGIVLLVAGCAVLGEALSTLFGFDILGVTPSQDFRQTGAIEVSLLGYTEDGGIFSGSLSKDNCDVTIEDPEGESHDCSFVGDEPRNGSEYNSIALLIDASGSMEVTYPEEEYGDFCLTCPHDPQRVRVEASQDFIERINQAAPETLIGVMSFGPEPSEGWDATQVLSDFTNDAESLSRAVERVAGDEIAGTPLYDSLAEIILATDDTAGTWESLLQKIHVDGNNNTVTCDPNDGEDDTVVVDGNNNTVTCDCSEGNTVIIDGNNNTVVCYGDEGNGSTPEGGSDDRDDPADDGASDGDGNDHDQPQDYAVRRTILVLSDGEDMNSVSYGLQDVIALAQEHDVTVHAIGLGPAAASFEHPEMMRSEQEAAVTALQRLADQTGGFYASVSDPEALRALYDHIAAGLTEGYNATSYQCEAAARHERGDHVRGNVRCGGRSEAFSFIAP